MANKPRLPRGATLDPEEAETIAAGGDPVLAGVAYTYWSRRFTDAREPLLDALLTSDTPAAVFSRALPNAPIEDVLPPRPPVLLVRVPLTRGGDANLLLDKAGCLMSAAEISEFVGGGGTVESLAEDLKAFADSPVTPAPPPVLGGPSLAARGLRAARELFDVVRRLRIARDHAVKFGLTVAECLALHRQEGALAITPLYDSFSQGPLILTAHVGCRESDVLHSLNVEIGRAIERPGFALVLPIAQYFKRLGIKGKTTTASMRFEALVTNMLVTGGLDNTTWLPENEGADEVKQLLFHAFKSPMNGFEGLLVDALGAPTTDFERPQLQRVLLLLLLNLIGVQIELPGALTSADGVMRRSIDALKKLMAMHHVETILRAHGTDVHMLGDGEGGDTEACLEVQAGWYASRKRLVTLMPRRDRSADVEDQTLSPLVAYLRFHTGDVLFMGLVLRALRHFATLIDAAKRRGTRASPSWGGEFLNSVAVSDWKRVTRDEKKQLADDLAHWVAKANIRLGDKNRANQETVWRHMGLIEALREIEPKPAWLEPFTPPAAKISTKAEIDQFADLQRIAQAATRTVRLVVDHDLLTPLQQAFETLPVTELVNAGVLPLPGRKAADIPKAFRPSLDPARRLLEWRKVAARAPLVKAHNFERLRLVYQKAWDVVEPPG